MLAFSSGMFFNNKYMPLDWLKPGLQPETQEQLKQKQIKILEKWLAEEERLKQQYEQKLTVQTHQLPRMRYTGEDRQY